MKRTEQDRNESAYLHWLDEREERDHGTGAIVGMFWAAIGSLVIWLALAAFWLKITGKW